MIARSAYIIQTRIVGLGRVPFDIGKDRRIRSIFRPVFESTTCLTDMRTSIEDAWRGVFQSRGAVPPLPDKPFLRNLGQVIFNTRSTRLSDSYDRSRLAELLGKRENYWDPKAKPAELPNHIGEREIFGYDHALEDQRMNHLYFELRRPLFMQAISESDVMADGRVFIHLYPSGFLAIHLAIAFKQPVLRDWIGLQGAILESRPWRSDNHWIWNTRLGSGKLLEVVQRVSEDVYQSLYSDHSLFPSRVRWHTALKLVTDRTPQQIADGLLMNRYKTLELGTYSPMVVEGQTGQWKRSERTYRKYLVSSDQGIVCVFSLAHKRRSAFRIFSKIHALYEFVLLKSRIYEDYIRHLRSEIVNLKEYRLSTIRKLAKEDIRRFSVFDLKISRYLLALDNHIQRASPYFRRVYSFLSQETAFDSRRETMLGLVEEWENEVELWEHSAVLLWKRALSPLKTLLGIG